ncbi:unnamed protein product [Paramecium octaurelia]|uniref:Uncharacterized protein n=1 Tax=Paramecium octaurelia TaxID=43137 RepID=A0A8S1YGB5_PAROT|nr:unnamed protein product [Paramecium octaurelia]
MIQNHPLCPKSAMEKYYMEQQLPKYQTLPPQQAQKKNHSYYHDNSNIWNNQHQSSSNMKVFAKIQEQKLRGEKRIKQLQKQEERDKQLYQMSKHIYFNQLKQEDHLRMQTRKLERAGLQNLSQQQSDIEADQLQLKPIQYNTTLQGRPELFWNKVGQHSQKHIRMLVNPKILAMEEEAVKLIEKRIENEHKVEQIRWDLKQENMKLIRKLNAKRQQENDEIHYKAGLSPSHKMGISKTIHVRRPSRASRPSLDIIEQTLQQIEEKQERTSRPFTVDSDKPSFSLHNSQSTKNVHSLAKQIVQAQQDSNHLVSIRNALLGWIDLSLRDCTQHRLAMLATTISVKPSVLIVPFLRESRIKRLKHNKCLRILDQLINLRRMQTKCQIHLKANCRIKNFNIEINIEAISFISSYFFKKKYQNICDPIKSAITKIVNFKHFLYG